MPAPTTPNQFELGLFGHARELVTVEDAADKMRVSKETLNRFVADRLLLFIPIGAEDKNKQRNHIRIVRSSVEALYAYRFKRANGVLPPFTLSPQAAWWFDQLNQRPDRNNLL